MKAAKDSVVYIVGEIISKALPFLLLPYLTRKLGVDGFGELSYYQAFIAIFLIFIGFSQHGAIARYYYVSEKKDINMVVLAGYTFNLSISLILILFFLLMKADMFVYIVLIASFQSLLDVQLTLRQCHKKALSYVKIQMLNSFLNITLTIVFLEFIGGNLVHGSLFAILVSVVIAFFISYFVYIRQDNESYQFSKTAYFSGLSYIFVFGLPLLLHGISGVIKGHLDKIIIFNKFSETDLGLYSSGLQLASVLSVIIMAINKALLPYYYEALKNDSLNFKKIRKIFLYSTVIVPLPAIMVYLVPQNLLVLFLGDGYNGVKHYMVMFVASMSLLVPYLILVNFLFYYAKNLIISLSSIFSTGVYLVLLYYFSTISIEKIPYASILSQFILLPLLYYYCYKVSLVKGAINDE